MKKSFVIVTLIVCHLMVCKAQVVDAFGGILPDDAKPEWRMEAEGSGGHQG